MSVPRNRQKESGIKFIDTFEKIRKIITFSLARDFGLKTKTYTIANIEKMYNITGFDAITLADILNRNKVSNLDVDKYPEWLIDTWRRDIMNIIFNIAKAIRVANSIWISNVSEYYSRRLYFSEAIGFCMTLEDYFQYVISCLSKDADLNNYIELFSLIDEEIRLLKGLKSSDNKVVHTLLQKDPSQVYTFFNAVPPHLYDYSGPTVPSFSNASYSGQQTLKEMVRIVDNDAQTVPIDQSNTIAGAIAEATGKASV